MSRIVRTIALSGAAAAAVLATAGTALADTPEAATVAAHATIAEQAGTPVTLPSGKTLRIPGMDSVSYRADEAHRTAVVTLADGTSAGTGVGTNPAGTGTGFDPRSGSVPQTGIGTGAVNPQQIQTQAGAGSISITAAVGLGLAFLVFFMVKGGRVKAGQAIVCIALGVYLTPTVVGPLIQSLGGSIGSSLGNVWSSF